MKENSIICLYSYLSTLTSLDILEYILVLYYTNVFLFLFPYFDSRLSVKQDLFVQRLPYRRLHNSSFHTVLTSGNCWSLYYSK